MNGLVLVLQTLGLSFALLSLATVPKEQARGQVLLSALAAVAVTAGAFMASVPPDEEPPQVGEANK